MSDELKDVTQSFSDQIDELKLLFGKTDKPTADEMAQRSVLLVGAAGAVISIRQNAELQKIIQADPDHAAYEAKLDELSKLIAASEAGWQATYKTLDAATKKDVDAKIEKAKKNPDLLKKYEGSLAALKVAKTIGDLGKTVKQAGSDLVDSIKGMFSDSPGTPGSDENETNPDGTKKEKHWWEKINVGDLIGGVLGAFGGWFAGNIFGGGLIGKIAGILLAIGGALMGKKMLGPKFNEWFGGKPKDDQLAANDPGKGRAPASTLAELPKGDATHEQLLKVVHDQILLTQQATEGFKLYDPQDVNNFENGASHIPHPPAKFKGKNV